MHRGIAAKPLGSILDHKLRTLNPVIRRDVAPRSRRYWAAPRKPGLVNAAFDLRHSGCGRTLVNNARPLGYKVHQHRALALVHCGRFQSLRLDRFAILPGPEATIGQTT